MIKRRVVITGMGAITPIGHTLEEVWDSVENAKCAIDFIERINVDDLDVRIAAEVKGFDPLDYVDKKAAKRMDRTNQFAVAAAKKAMEDSGLNIEEMKPERVGIMVSSGIGGIETIETEHLKALKRSYNRMSPFFVPMIIGNLNAALIAIEIGAHGVCQDPVTACAGGNNAIGDAFRAIKDGYQDVVLCGGSEANITHLGMGGFISMKALNTSNNPKRASIPFDKEREGFVMGEGSALLVLEELEQAKARGAKIYGEIVGYGHTNDANHITAPNPEGKWAARAMEMAMEEAGINPSDIDYINAHGTSTPLNDKSETIAVKRAFGDEAYNVKMSSTKAMTGHLLGASGAIEAVITTLAINKGFVPPTINYQVPDEECDLDIVPNKGLKQDIHYAMSNALGFGGHNISIIFKEWKE